LSEPLARKLSAISNDVYHGRGVAVLRGLDAANFNEEESVIAFAGVSSYVCPSRATDSYAFQTLSHVRDATHDPVPEFAKGLGLAGSKVGTAMVRHMSPFANVVTYTSDRVSIVIDSQAIFLLFMFSMMAVRKVVASSMFLVSGQFTTSCWSQIRPCWKRRRLLAGHSS
jgi:hypothetical protein